MNNAYTPVIGMEIHAELKTKSKMFCGCKNDPFGAPGPNTYTCPVCLGLPGALPVPNRQAVEWTILLGLALGSTIALKSKFDRKNYFYPDLAKGYQISQYDMPLCLGGIVKTELGDVRIHRVHLEEDTGKLQHTSLGGQAVSLVDFNRSGVPLVEIVTEPDIHSGEQAKVFLKKLHQIIRFLDISGADMEKGSMRLEPNISVQIPGQTELPKYKVEVKNINSFNFVKKAIEFEVARHIEILKTDILPPQETRGWNEDKGISVSQRSKEEAHDYRYFPEPDIPPMSFTKEFIETMRKTLPELPDAKHDRFVATYGLSAYDVSLLIDEPERAGFFESCVQLVKSPVTAKIIANWIINKKGDTTLSPDKFVALISAANTVEAVSDDVIDHAVLSVLTANPKAVTDFRSGKEQVKMFLFGMVLKELKGKGDKGKVMELLLNALHV
jgi:aspartyl-tRNA(Asn)/glutamyl-tRNA(Gln) amidotransferase subunit B